ncbi:Insulin receptor, partial [Frankliniella fusca]
LSDPRPLQKVETISLLAGTRIALETSIAFPEVDAAAAARRPATTGTNGRAAVSRGIKCGGAQELRVDAVPQQELAAQLLQLALPAARPAGPAGPAGHAVLRLLAVGAAAAAAGSPRRVRVARRAAGAGRRRRPVWNHEHREDGVSRSQQHGA